MGVEPLISVSSSVSIRRYVSEGLGFPLPTWSVGADDDTINPGGAAEPHACSHLFGTAHF